MSFPGLAKHENAERPSGDNDVADARVVVAVWE